MKVLVVDDTKTLHSLIQVYLMGQGLEFVQACDGLEGLRLARAARPDLIITDVKMPMMDGFELCAAIRADPDLRAVPIVLLTALSDEASRRRGSEVGATAFLSKPVKVDELRSTVQRVMKLPTR